MSKRAPRRRRFTLTRQGKGYVFVTVGVGIAAVNTGNNLLYLILGLLLSLLLVSGTLSDLALYQLRAKRRLPTRLYVGRPHAVEITLENLKQFGALKAAAQKLRLNKLFDSAKVASSARARASRSSAARTWASPRSSIACWARSA